MTDVERLERASELADARLGVAEELAWVVAALAGLAAHLTWDYWMATGAVFAAGFFLTTYAFKKQANKAEDAYYRAAHLGKYMVPHEPDSTGN